MITCEPCKGTGKMKLGVVDIVTGPDGKRCKKESSVEIDCIHCKGTGKVTEAYKKALTDHLADWCTCKGGNTPGNWRFYDDGEHPKCRKHHYRCGSCHKITQVG